MSTPTVTIGVATYNRMNYLTTMVASLQASVDLSRVHVRLYDDASTDYNLDALHNAVPFATEIVRRPTNLRADRNTYQMYNDFLATNDDIFVNADSDLLFRPGWLDVALEILPLTDGLLSLYNSNMHPFLEDTTDTHPQHTTHKFSPKQHIGSAGTVMHREIVQFICDSLDESNVTAFDWKFSELLQQKGKKLYVLHDSYIQHIGVLGQNNVGSIEEFDYGRNFLPVSEVNQRAITNFIDELIYENQQCQEEQLQRLERTTSYVKIVLQSWVTSRVGIWKRELNKFRT